jgi:hypothetical protein
LTSEFEFHQGTLKSPLPLIAYQDVKGQRHDNGLEPSFTVNNCHTASERRDDGIIFNTLSEPVRAYNDHPSRKASAGSM